MIGVHPRRRIGARTADLGVGRIGVVFGVLVTLIVAAVVAWRVEASLNSSKDVASVVPAPGPPSVTVVGVRSVELSWDAVTLPSGAAVTGYTVTASPASGVSRRPGEGTCAGTVTITTCTYTNLPDDSWQFRVAAVLGASTSTSSELSESVAIPPGGCAAPANEIVAENCKPGNPPSEWDVVGAGDPDIQGFSTDISVNRGQRIDFKIDTQSIDFRIDVYRLGYYDGDGARKVATIPTTATTETRQPACLLIDGTTDDNLVDCGNWSISASWTPPADAVSGIYVARLVRQDVGGDLASHVVFVVRDDDGGSELLFQTSDTTWQAYNRYGGYSLYEGPGHAHKVSYNRPFTTRAAPTEDWVFNSEYPMLRWLEHNGYDVSYSTDVDTERFGAEILEHETFLSVGHDEYWSAGQRTSVEAARNAGVNLGFFGGNEIYWKSRWEPSTADGGSTNYRTLVSYKEGDSPGGEHYNCSGDFDCDPHPTEWTGMWRQNQAGHDGGKPENALSGQISWDDTSAAIQVPASFTGLRLWRNTGMSGATTLAANTLGYEFDWEQSDFITFYPGGRITMSETVAEGKTHKVSLYRAPSGALVFGAGTVQWAWGLDGTHDRGGSSPDLRMQQATVNILSDMGADPATLQVDVVPGGPLDMTFPSTTITSPVDGAGLAGGSIEVAGAATDTVGVVASVEVSIDGGVSWSQATGTTDWSYTFNASNRPLTVLARAVDDAANIGPTTSVGIVVEAQICPCSVFGQPGPGGVATDDVNSVELGMRFSTYVAGQVTGVRFWKPEGQIGTHVGHLWTSDGRLLGEVAFTEESATGWQVASFAAPIPISANTTYVVSYHAPMGRYAGTHFFFGSDVDSWPLRAPADAADSPNGVYRYGPTAEFPRDTFQSSNYWVDVTFTADTAAATTNP